MKDEDIRLLSALPELEAAVELQRSYWGAFPEDIVPLHMLLSFARHGGHVLGAFERAQGRLVALLVGFPGLVDGASSVDEVCLVSKRMVVHAGWRNRGLARRLKLAQRERALSQGIRSVRWSFDPLLAPNAWLNLHRLGARATHFCEDYFGPAGLGGQAQEGSPDRLLVDWQLESERVRALVAGRCAGSDLPALLEAGAPLLQRVRFDDEGRPRPGELAAPPAGPALLEIPLDFPALARSDPGLAQEWRLQLRAAMEALFAAGHVLEDCARGVLEGRERLFYVSGPPQEEVIVDRR